MLQIAAIFEKRAFAKFLIFLNFISFVDKGCYRAESFVITKNVSSLYNCFKSGLSNLQTCYNSASRWLGQRVNPRPVIGHILAIDYYDNSLQCAETDNDE